VIKRLIGLAVPLLLLAGCAGTTSAGTTVTVQVPTTVFVTGPEPAAAEPTEEAAPTEAAADAIPPVGSSIPFTWSAFGDDDQGTATVNTAEWTTEADEFGGLPDNGAYLILDVTVEATKGSVSVNPLYWSAKDAEGRTYKSGFTSGKDPALDSGDIPAGQKSRGFVAIDAPQVPLTVQLSSMGSGAVASWAVPA
jgi:hypothetical protein